MASKENYVKMMHDYCMAEPSRISQYGLSTIVNEALAYTDAIHKAVDGEFERIGLNLDKLKDQLKVEVLSFETSDLKCKAPPPPRVETFAELDDHGQVKGFKRILLHSPYYVEETGSGFNVSCNMFGESRSFGFFSNLEDANDYCTKLERQYLGNLTVDAVGRLQ